MADSVELTLDTAADEELRAQWRRLAAAGLPSAQRSRPTDGSAPPPAGGRSTVGDEHHRPHLTLFAAHAMPDGADERLTAEFAGKRVDLALRVGSLMIFGPRRGHCILVRAVVPSAGLLALQQRVLAAVGEDPLGQFGDGRWTPHLTLARRIEVGRLGDAVAVLGPERTVTSYGVRMRRWDGTRRAAWWLTD
jgi:hypothetical protein